MSITSLQEKITIISRMILSYCCFVRRFIRENSQTNTQKIVWRFSTYFISHTIHTCPQSAQIMLKRNYSKSSTTYWIVSASFRKAVYMVVHIVMRENAEYITRLKGKKKRRQKLFNRPLKRLCRGHKVKVWSMFLVENAVYWQGNTRYSYDFIEWRVYSAFQSWIS